MTKSTCYPITCSPWSIAGICVILLFGGCVSEGKNHPDQSQDTAKVHNEDATKDDGMAMVGRTRDELVKRFGKPQQTMDVTLLGRPASEAYLYEGEKGCTDSYVIVENTGIIIDYFCR